MISALVHDCAHAICTHSLSIHPQQMHMHLQFCPAHLLFSFLLSVSHGLLLYHVRIVCELHSSKQCKSAYDSERADIEDLISTSIIHMHFYLYVQSRYPLITYISNFLPFIFVYYSNPSWKWNHTYSYTILLIAWSFHFSCPLSSLPFLLDASNRAANFDLCPFIADPFTFI